MAGADGNRGRLSMKVLNQHERSLPGSAQDVGALIDTLASPGDVLWPHQHWPAMRFDRALTVGAVGGHGPIRYVVEDYQRGQRIRFRFTAPAGFDGYHEYQVVADSDASSRLRHVLRMTTHGRAVWSWPLLYRPLHDALIEDSLVCAQRGLALRPDRRPWSVWVRFLRWLLRRAQGLRSSLRPVSRPLLPTGGHSAPRSPTPKGSRS